MKNFLIAAYIKIRKPRTCSAISFLSLLGAEIGPFLTMCKPIAKDLCDRLRSCDVDTSGSRLPYTNILSYNEELIDLET